MAVLKGSTVSPGLARGVAIVYDFEVGRKVRGSTGDVSRNDVEREWERLDKAIEESTNDLKFASKSADRRGVEATSVSIASAHAAMTAEISSLVKSRISCELVNVEKALEAVTAEWVEKLTRLDSEYLRQREQDVRDVGRRMTRYLSGSMPWSKGPITSDSIVVARELMPSEIIELANCGVMAIVSDHGGRYSHTAILARSLGIPMVTGVIDATRSITPGTPLIVDGDRGEVVLDPTPREVEAFSQRVRLTCATARSEIRACDQPCVTRDGVMVKLEANVGRPEEIAQVVEHQLTGVGLFRTEFVFIDSQVRPDIATQVEIYASMAKELDGRPLVVRTFDLGADKTPPFLLTEEREAHKGLHLGGLRFSLAESRLFETQVQAVLEVSQEYDLRLLLPMVIGSDDFVRAVSVIQRVADRCGLLRTPTIGVMIETPAVLFALEEVLDMADFVALGTNDLTQHLLATDRDLAQSQDDCTAMHPSVLRAIKRVVDAAIRLQCPLCVCGEEASDPAFASLLIGLGVRDLSLSPRLADRVRLAIRQIDSRDARKIAERALCCESPAEVRSLVEEWLAAAETEMSPEAADRQSMALPDQEELEKSRAEG